MVAVNHADGDITTHSKGVLERTDSEARLHPGVDRVPNDLVDEHVLDCAEVKLALTRLVLGDVSEPELIRGVRGELVPDPAVLVCDGAEIVVNGRAGVLVVLAPFLPERGPPRVRGRDQPRSPIRRRLTRATSLVRKETMPELRVITVRVNSAFAR